MLGSCALPSLLLSTLMRLPKQSLRLGALRGCLPAEYYDVLFCIYFWQLTWASLLDTVCRILFPLCSYSQHSEVLGPRDPAVLTPVLIGGLVLPLDWYNAVECLQGRTPLLWAIEKASLNMVALLLSRGADCVNLDNLLVSALMGHCLAFPCC